MLRQVIYRLEKLKGQNFDEAINSHNRLFSRSEWLSTERARLYNGFMCMILGVLCRDNSLLNVIPDFTPHDS